MSVSLIALVKQGSIQRAIPCCLPFEKEADIFRPDRVVCFKRGERRLDLRLHEMNLK